MLSQDREKLFGRGTSHHKLQNPRHRAKRHHRHDGEKDAQGPNGRRIGEKNRGVFFGEEGLASDLFLSKGLAQLLIILHQPLYVKVAPGKPFIKNGNRFVAVFGFMAPAISTS